MNEVMTVRERIARAARGEKVPPVTIPEGGGDRDLVAECFAAIEDAVRDGARAPLNAELPGLYRTLRVLCDDGKVRSETYSKNWRVLEIRVGELAGKRTMEPPQGGVPYKVIGGPRV